MDPSSQKQEVPADIYTQHYYLTDNEGCREYEQGLDKNIHPKFERALELASIKPGNFVLDVGCGRGELLYYCALDGAKCLGLDYSPAAVELAQKTIQQLPMEFQPNVQAHVGNMEQYPYPNKYNYIFMIEVAEHMHDWQLEAAFKKFHHILTDDGTLIIMTPNYLYEKYLQPWKMFLDIPFQMIKQPLRVLRGKYKPKSFNELLNKIFRVKVDRGELNRKMHVNITTPGRLKRLLKDFNTDIRCEDHSLAPISLLFKKWMGREIVVVARKK